MTDYINNPYLKVADEYLKDKKWYKDDFFASLGKFKWPLKYNDQTKVQLNKVIFASIADSLPFYKRVAGKSVLRAVYQKMAVSEYFWPIAPANKGAKADPKLPRKY